MSEKLFLLVLFIYETHASKIVVMFFFVNGRIIICMVCYYMLFYSTIILHGMLLYSTIILYGMLFYSTFVF